MFTIPYAIVYSDLPRFSLFSVLLPLNCEMLSYLFCLTPYFSKWLFLDFHLCLDSLRELPFQYCKMQRSATGTENPVS